MQISSVGSMILMIVREIGEITVNAFFNPKYAKKYGYGNRYEKRNSYHVAISRLRRRGFITQYKNKEIYRLTSLGEKEAFLCALKDFRLSTDKNSPQDTNWDGRWRMIFFDIPEKKRRYRDELRLMLKVIGFKEFQKSIWAYPYKVPNFLKEILFEEQMKHYTRLITTDKIEYDKDLRRMFKL